jgi:hypothetical protein
MSLFLNIFANHFPLMLDGVSLARAVVAARKEIRALFASPSDKW